MTLAPTTPAPAPSRARNNRRAIEDCSHFPVMRISYFFFTKVWRAATLYAQLLKNPLIGVWESRIFQFPRRPLIMS